MRIIRSAALLFAAALFAAPLAAQSAGTFDVGIFGRADWLDASYHTNTGSGFGARAGFFPFRNFELQADYSWNSNPGDNTGFGTVKYEPFHARLGYFIPLGRTFSFLIGAGYTHEKFSNSGVTRSDDAFGGVAGLRLRFGHSLYALVDYTADYSKDPVTKSASVSSTLNNGLEFGIGFLLGGKHREQPKAAPPPPPAPAPAPVAAVVIVDDDHDGVANVSDRCPNTPAGASVDANGCAPSQLDDDNDKVMNDADKCPNTAAGAVVDSNGCSDAQRDDDRDGVTNDKDECPNTPANIAVDARGCNVKPIVLKNVTFQTNNSILQPGSAATLDTIVAALKAHPSIRIQISGYADSVGAEKRNMRLSNARAQSVRSYILGKGITPDRVVAVGYGEADPIAPNNTPEGRAENRRVELLVLPE